MRGGRLRLRVRTHNKQSRCVPLSLIDVDRRRKRVAEEISFAFRDGVWIAERMAARAGHDLGLPVDQWLSGLAVGAVEAFPEPPDDRPRAFLSWVTAELDRSTAPAVEAWIIGEPPGPDVDDWFGPALRRHPSEMAERRWLVPSIGSVRELCSYLRHDPSELAWYADTKSLERSVNSEDLRHYTYYWLPKKRGSARLVEAPKQNLKYVQRRLLREIIDQIPPHEAAHGFRRGRSIQTYAAPHTAREVVLRFDLRDFFLTVPAGRVFGIFYSAGYPDEVAHALTGLTTNAVPAEVRRERPSPRPTSDARLRSPHLPQGAPTSPALANLAAFALDVRLSALARRFDAQYTRYADDLAISGGGELVDGLQRFLPLVKEIVRDEGFIVNEAKTSRRSKHQRQVLTGMVVNQHLNLHRRDYDRLRAVLHDALVNGPAAANRSGHPQFRSHLEGKISFVQATNPQRARKLWAAFDKIDWITS